MESWGLGGNPWAPDSSGPDPIGRTLVHASRVCPFRESRRQDGPGHLLWTGQAGDRDAPGRVSLVRRERGQRAAGVMGVSVLQCGYTRAPETTWFMKRLIRHRILLAAEFRIGHLHLARSSGRVPFWWKARGAVVCREYAAREEVGGGAPVSPNSGNPLTPGRGPVCSRGPTRTAKHVRLGPTPVLRIRGPCEVGRQTSRPQPRVGEGHSCNSSVHQLVWMSKEYSSS